MTTPTPATQYEARADDGYMDTIREAFDRVRETCECCQATSGHRERATRRAIVTNTETGQVTLTMALCDVCAVVFLVTYYWIKFRGILARMAGLARRAF